ncbi:O-methyltransferase [Amycolatopsis sp. WAC 01375]|uniref:O-methyltransferase n=1 Tax=Amycolatopsis sp. WAC 01375 TaxID=2203194 RepID=UPI000F77F2B0|nr:O-methyltransferase [Amycolatopsis sp. WAC 01375]
MMPAIKSYEARPAKAITRKILVELLRHLKPLAPLSKFQYVGFGALEFLDFEIIHRSLGIDRMISIEGDVDKVERYTWNRPFKGIDVLPGRTSVVLPSLDWSGLSIVWLDYVSTLDSEVLMDVELISRKLRPGSVLAVTINAHPQKLDSRVAALEAFVGPERVPPGVNDSKLGGWGLADVQRQILSSSITSTISNRTDEASWHQLLNIYYQDSAKMQLLVGIVGGVSMDSMIKICKFEDLAEYRDSEAALTIKVPLLTNREQDWINQRVADGVYESGCQIPGVPKSDVDDYRQIYRWLESTA